MRYMTIGLKRTVSLALLPVDDFTDRAITGSGIRMYTVEGGKASIRKDNGYHVFCDLEKTPVHICIEGPLYQKQVICILPGETPVIQQVRMMPGRAYPIPAGATCLRGMLPPGSRLRLFFPENKKGYKLLYDYNPEKQGRRLGLFCQEDARLAGKLLCITGSGEKTEFFRMADWDHEEGTLEKPLSRPYKKIGTTVFPVYEATAAEDGSVYLPVRSLPENSSASLFLLPAGEQEEQQTAELVLTAGRENLIAAELFQRKKESRKKGQQKGEQ